MRLQSRLFVMGAVVLFCSFPPTLQSSNDRHAPVRPLDGRLKAARAAIGGEAKLRQVKSLILQGTTQPINGATGALLDPHPLEVMILSPDRL